MSEKLLRRKSRKLQLKINNKIKKTYYKYIMMAPCYYCKYVFLINNLTIEHLVPRSIGGSNDISNITLACAPCNRQKGREFWFLKKKIWNNSQIIH